MTVIIKSDNVASANIGNLFGVIGPSDYTALLDFENENYRVLSGESRVAVSLNDAISCTRNSVSTTINSSGVLVDVPTNTPRIFKNPAGRVGLLSEYTRANSLLNSDAPATQTLTALVAGIYVLWVNGAGSATPTGDISDGGGVAATDGNPVVFTVVSPGSVTVTVTGTLTRFQMELCGVSTTGGVFDTTYIRTTSAKVTRAQDILKLSSTVFNSVVGQTEGTFVIHGIPRASLAGNTTNVGTRWVLRLGESTSSTGNLNIQHNSAGSLTAGIVNDAGTAQMSATMTPAAGFNPFAMVMGYKADDSIAQVGGVAVKDAAVTLPTSLDQLEIGSSQYSVATIGLITKLIIYNRRLTDDEINTIARLSQP